jgi:hypothetical protein
MNDENLTPEQKAILEAAHAAPAALAPPTAPNPYQPPGVPQNAPPRPQFSAVQPAKYKPWTRPLTYVVFGLGMAAAGFLMFSILPHAIVTGWFALGCGIPAFLLAKKEIGRFPEAEGHGFIKWGRRTGLLGIIIGPASAVIWIIIVAAIGFSF